MRDAAGFRRALTASSPAPIVRFATSLGTIDVELNPNVAPKNVANFLSYVNGGAYANSIIHRSVPGFIVQGGGYTLTPGPNLVAIPAPTSSVGNEFGLSNVRGTLTMAQQDGATSQWFFNSVDNSSTLDSSGGGYTVIGNIVTAGGLAVMDAIAALPVTSIGSPFDQLPVVNYTSGAPLAANNFVTVSSISPVASHPSFFNGETSLGNGVNSLAFPNGNFFGFYSYLVNENYLFHFDLGYEYALDANDGQSGIYLYDFASGHYFYTSPTFPFPYLYDFTLGSVVYYYPSSSAGHYTSGPRYFYDFKSLQIITE